MGTLTNIKVEPCSVTWGSLDLGYLDGNVEVTTEEVGAEITAHQHGANVLDMIRTGKTLEVGLTLKEFHAANFQAIYGAGGAVATAQPEITTVTCVADVSSSLSAKYFTLNTALDAIHHYVWINVAAGSTDPAPSGLTGVSVAISANATASTVATAVASAVDALPGYTATSSGAVVTITHATNGGATDAADVDTGFTIAVTQQGYSAVYGWGTSKDFTAVTTQAAKLIMHPVVLASTDLSRDLAFWLAYPMPDSIVYSGEDPQSVSVKFKIFPDLSRPTTSSWFVRGSHL